MAARIAAVIKMVLNMLVSFFWIFFYYYNSVVDLKYKYFEMQADPKKTNFKDVKCRFFYDFYD